MDSVKFPINMGNDMAGLTFKEIFDTKPKIIEFVRTSWIKKKCSGLFLDFFVYCSMMLKHPSVLEEHQSRCYKFVETIQEDKLPDYMKDYKLKDANRNDVLQ